MEIKKTRKKTINLNRALVSLLWLSIKDMTKLKEIKHDFFKGYKISVKGNVTNKLGTSVNPSIDNSTGYVRVTLCENGVNKKFYIHRLIAQAFIPNPRNLPQVNHKNGVKTDNRIENLEWVTQRDNLLHARKIGLTPRRTYTRVTENDVRYIRSVYVRGDMRIRNQLAKKFNISLSTVKSIGTKQNWKDVD